MNETQILWTLGEFSLTPFGLCLALGATAAMLLTVLLGRKSLGVPASLSLCLVTLPMAVLGARVAYCLTMLESILVDLGGAGFMPKVWLGGFTLYGAILGGMLGVWLYAVCTHRKAAALMDLAAPGAALMILVERLAESFTTQGLGDYVMEESMQRFPFAVQSAYGDWQAPVFLYEAFAALVILCVVLFGRYRAAGRKAETFIILLGLTQILLESWREDEFIRFGFVRFTQIAAIVTVAAVLALRLIRCIKAQGWTRWQITRIVLFVLGIGVCIGIEFALDKSTIDNTLLYLVMAGMLTVMGCATLIDGKKASDACTMRKEMVQ